MKRIFLTISLVLGSLGISGSPAVADDVIKVAAIYAETGDAAADNILHYAGAHYAVDEINQNGGVLGKKIQLIDIDNQSTALGSRAAAEQAVADGVVAVIGASYSSHSLAMAPVLQQNKIVMLSPIATNPDVTLVGNYIFRACFIDSFLGKIGAEFVYDHLRAKRVVIMTNVSDKYSLGLSEYFLSEFKELGGSVVGQQHYLNTTTDFSDLLAQIKTLNPDLIFLPGFYKDSGLIMKQAREMGITTTFLGGDGWNDEMYKFGRDAVNGNYFFSHWDRLSTLPKSQAFVRAFEAKSGTVIRTPGTALAYDSVYLLADAITRAHSTNPTKIRDALAMTKNFQGVTGSITFDKNRNPMNKPAIIFQFQNGTSVYRETVTPR